MVGDARGDGVVVAAALALPTGRRTKGAFKLRLLEEAGRGYQLLASTNLGTKNWTVTGVMESTSRTWRLFDFDATNHARRFYRAQRLP